MDTLPAASCCRLAAPHNRQRAKKNSSWSGSFFLQGNEASAATLRVQGNGGGGGGGGGGGSLFPGILPVVPVGTEAPIIPDKDHRTNAATAASAASVRAISAQALQFYFRAPVKAFFRTRVDYLAYARDKDDPSKLRMTTNQTTTTTTTTTTHRLRRWFRGTTPGVLALAIRRYGWSVVPDQVLPPLIANIGVAAVLYTSYLHILGTLHPESSQARRRVYPPPSPLETMTAGFLAGSLQSVLAAPLDAIQARYDHGAVVPDTTKTGAPQSMWTFSAAKLREIGLRGIFAGWGLSFLKDSCGSAVFFSVFEYVKAQGYYRYVTWYYGGAAVEDAIILAHQQRQRDELAAERRVQRRQWLQRLREGRMGSEQSLSPSQDPPKSHDSNSHDLNSHDLNSHNLNSLNALHSSHYPIIIRPHYTLEPLFLLLAGISASFAQQLLLHPLTHIQVVHWDLLEDLDAVAAAEKQKAAAAAATVSGETTVQPHYRRFHHVFRIYYHAYLTTWHNCAEQAAAEGLSRTAWLYRGFWWNAIRQVPSTSAGLIIFELVRRKYGYAGEGVRISQDGFDILLT